MPEASQNLIEKRMDQDFQNTGKRLDHYGEALVQHSNFIPQAMQAQHLLSSQLVGAFAAQTLNQDKTARDVLQTNATRDQPGVNLKS
jgi:hypothetical protein